MGTQVNYKSYLLGYYHMRDLNKKAGNSWSFCYEDRTVSGKFHSGFTLKPANGYAECDKEVLKQTMLRHEEIFRKQVCELHRLYRKQRDLMDELKRKEEHNFCVQVHSSESSPFSIKMLPKDREKSWQGRGFPSANASCSRTTVSGIDDAQAHLKFLNGSSYQTGLVSRENGSSQGVNELTDSNIRKLPRRMLDLQLPADAYIDNEDAEHANEKIFIKPLSGTAHPSNIKFGFFLDNDVKLTLGAAQNHGHRNETRKSGSDVQKGLHPHNLVDLNEPLREVICEELAVSSCNFAVQMTHCEGLQEHQNSVRSASEFQGCQKNLFQDRYKSGGSVFLNVDRGEKGWDHPLFKNEIGQSNSHVNCFTSNLSNTNARPSSEHVVIKTKNGQDLSSKFSLKQNETESWFREKPSQSIEPSNSSYISNTKYLGLTVPTTLGPLSALPHTDNAGSVSSLLSNSTSHAPLAIQALSCFSESTTNIQSRSSSTSSQNLGNACEKWQCSHGSRSTLSYGGEARFCPNGFQHSFRSESSASSHVYLPSVNFDKPNLNNGASSAYDKLEGNGLQMCFRGLHCTDMKTANDMNLDLASPSGFQNESASEQKRPGDVQGKRESIPGGLSWLRTKSSCGEPLNISNDVRQEELDVEQGYSPLMLNHPTTWEIDEKKETKDIHSLDALPLTLKAKGTIIQQNEASVISNSKRILGFIVPQRTQYSPADNVKNRVKEKFLHTDSSFHGKFLDLEKQIHTELDVEKGVVKCANGFMGQISLSSSETSTDQLKALECSSKDEVQLPSPLSVRDTAPRFASEIDLEAPITSMAEEQMPSSGSALDFNQLVSPVEPERKRDVLHGTEIGDETIVRMAAETIHTMSLDKRIHLEDIAVCPPPPASVDTLNWFADVVTSNSDDLENVLEASRGGGEQGSSDIGGMDYFEYMTLNLKEVNVDEYCSRPSETETPKEEETSVAHLLLTKPRRGQARRRQQRRDFQKDILPGLASLSRHEVTEDLQIIGGLMRASGQSWQVSGSRRNNGRTWSRSQTRGRGRSRSTSAAAAMVEIPLDPHSGQPSNAEVKIDGRSILGWGRTTRRCWRQRCSSGNILVPPPT